MGFTFFAGTLAIVTSLALSGFALFAIGAATSVFTGQGAPPSGLRQLAFGYVAAGITFGIGHLIGVAINV